MGERNKENIHRFSFKSPIKTFLGYSIYVWKWQMIQKMTLT